MLDRAVRAQNRLRALHLLSRRESGELAPDARSGREVRGPRQLGSPHLAVSSTSTYLDTLRLHQVEPDPSRRRTLIVEQAEAFRYAPALREHCPLNVHGEGEEVDVAEALTDLGRRGSRSGSAVEVTTHLVLKGNRQEHVTLLDALAPLALEQTLSAAEPACGRPHLSP